MGKILRLLAALIVLTGAVGAIYAWVGSNNGDENGLKLVEVELGSITEKALAVGQIEPRERFQIKSKISGIVRRALVEVGDEGLALRHALTLRERVSDDHYARSILGSALTATQLGCKAQRHPVRGLLDERGQSGDPLRPPSAGGWIAEIELEATGRVVGVEVECPTLVCRLDVLRCAVTGGGHSS